MTKAKEIRRGAAEQRQEARKGRTDQQQLARLDELLGKGRGAVKERTRLVQRIAAGANPVVSKSVLKRVAAQVGQ